MARVRGPATEAQSLELWIKGPVFYGAEVAVRTQDVDGGIELGVALEGDDRSALLGRWTGA
jgi:hypothetical protein